MNMSNKDSELEGISVVIPNYNGMALLEQNLPHLINALIGCKLPYEIIIPDDASSDQSINFLELHYPSVLIVKNKFNQGFATNINSGIFLAKYNLVFLMNSDVQLVGDYFSPLLPYFKLPDTFGVMGKIIGLDNDLVQDGAKIFANNLLKIDANQNILPLSSSSNQILATAFLSGANALVDRKKLMLLNGFDEGFSPFYGEDLDLSIRAWRVGWQCYFEAQSVCRHPNSVTIKKHNKSKFIKTIVYRNRFYFHAIHLPLAKMYCWNTWLLIQIVSKTIFFKTEFLKAYSLYLKQSNQVELAKEKLKILSNKTGVLLSLAEVVKKVRQLQSMVSHQKL
jgi:GT2 family glycosyltransferase